ncbi:MAG: hypothetical protein NTX29_10230 [Actinobacteria bacterium]|nr:hypothetical protein [Actinomycetota bacterium]
MTRDRLLLALGTVTAVAAGLLLGAAPASAASYTLNLTMDATTCVVTAPATQTLQTGDSVTITNTAGGASGCQLFIVGTSNLTGWTQTLGAGATVSLAGSASTFSSMGMNPSITLVVGTVSADIYTDRAGRVSTVATYSSSGGGGGSGGSGGVSGATSGSGPAPLMQQFARPAMGTCDAAQPEGLNWAGVASGGWSESWAQWANGGQGGTVCTRMLEYVNSWRIAS